MNLTTKNAENTEKNRMAATSKTFGVKKAPEAQKLITGYFDNKYEFLG